jgi:hypothetical protein
VALVGVFIFGIASGQEILFEKEIKLKRGLDEKREAYPVVNPANESLALFLIDSKSIKANIFDKHLQLSDTLEGPRPETFWVEILGSNFSGSKYNLFFAAKPYESFVVMSFDVSNRSVRQGMVKIPFDKKERYAGSASYRGKFYVFTTLKGTSVLKLYAFDDEKNYSTHLYDFKAERFTATGYPTLFDAVRENPLTFIDNEVPNAIELVSKKNKLYGYGNNLALTLDNQSTRTILIKIDLTTFEHTLTFYPHAKSECGLASTTNSYLYKDHLYQLVVCSTEMIFSIGSLQKGEIVNEFRAVRDEDISFKNSAIVQEGGGHPWVPVGERELSKTKQFLRKVSASDIGISVYQSSAGMEIILGGTKELPSGAPMGGGMTPGTTISTPYGPMTTAPTYNPTYGGYNSYKSSRSVHFKSLLNPTTFEHLTGDMPKNIFDKIKIFTKSLDESIIAETLFKKGNACILGYYFKPDRRYVMRKFTD